MKIDHGIAPESPDPQFECQTWWRSPEDTEYSLVDHFIAKSEEHALSWLTDPLDALKAEERGDIFEKRILYKDTVDCIAYRRFKIELSETLIEQNIKF